MGQDFQAALRRALAATRGGDPAGATRLIQDALRGGAPTMPPAAPPANPAAAPTMRAPRRAAQPAFHVRPDAADAEIASTRARFACAHGARDYLLHLPPRMTRGAAPRGLVLMLHGCTQDAADFARGTGMDDVADRADLITVWPEQTAGANPNRCWNWFRADDQDRAGEAALLAALARDVAARHGVPDGAIFAAGLSAGGAMAALLGQNHADTFAAIGVHSGLPAGAARDMPGAFRAMATGGGGDPASGRAIVFHGTADRTVHPANAMRLCGLTPADRPERETMRGGRRVDRHVRRDPSGRPTTELWSVAGLGHAWSGGRRGGSHADPAGPDASAEMVRFFLSPSPPATRRGTIEG